MTDDLEMLNNYIDGRWTDRYRKEWLYSRAATIYGGTSEIPPDIIAGRLLDLPAP